ncbi:MAG TPA: ATP-binding protein [Terriglobales bacterium]|nr:ATP-binding protein [Terriglobales bacterium]
MTAAAATRSASRNEHSTPEWMLGRAFASFTEAANTLERSYVQLQDQVVRLRAQLEESNRDLARSLEENQRMRQYLDRIVERLPCGVLVVNASGAVSLANPEARRLLGCSDDQLPAKVSEFPPALAAALEYARAKGGECQLGTPKPGEAKLSWMSIRHAALDHTGGQSSVYILRDMAEQRRLENEREVLRRRQALADISAALAHEIRNPLGSMELFAGLLSETALSADARRWAEHLQSGVRGLAATVNNVLQVHNPKAAEWMPLDVAELLHWAQEFLSPLARQAKILVEVENRVSGVQVAGDRNRLQQVLLNLSLNAMRAMNEGGWLKIRSQVLPDQREVEIAVADTGPGIAEENQERIFEAGFSTRSGSPGLGLAVSKTIVEQHGGHISAENRCQGGALFRLTFPLSRSAP